MTAGETVTGLQKTPSGINGLDEITFGGLPKARATLLVGGAGTGKTMLAMQFIASGAKDYGEPGVYVSFEETEEELLSNFASLRLNARELYDQKKIEIDHIRVERNDIEETGEYNLDGLFVRLGYAIDSIGAKRVVLDTIEALFGSFQDPGILRTELRRLFRWLKDKGVTALVTGERGDANFTRFGLEEYVADCVILLDTRTVDQVTTRRLRVVKYRGSGHGTNEYPFLIDDEGITIVPVTSLGLKHEVAAERVSTGISQLDNMFGGNGYFRGSSVLVSGTAGTGKTSVAAHFVNAAAERGEKALYFAFEESPSQIVRNMSSIGLDLKKWVEGGQLVFHATRPNHFGLEMHLTKMIQMIRQTEPEVVVVDPITNLTTVGDQVEVKSMLTRLIDYLKMNNITALFTSLTEGGTNYSRTDVGVSSLMDTWILLKLQEISGEQNRTIQILKSRGMPHSNQVREFVMTEAGVRLVDVYAGPEGVLTGTARAIQEAQDKASKITRQQETERRKRDLERKWKLVEAQVEALRADFEREREETEQLIMQESLREQAIQENREETARLRQGIHTISET